MTIKILEKSVLTKSRTKGAKDKVKRKRTEKMKMATVMKRKGMTNEEIKYSLKELFE